MVGAEEPGADVFAPSVGADGLDAEAEIGRVGAAEGVAAEPEAVSWRASVPAGDAGVALSRAGFLSSFGSDTHYPSLGRNI